MKRKQILVASIFVLLCIGGASMVSSPTAMAAEYACPDGRKVEVKDDATDEDKKKACGQIKCTVLPEAICNNAGSPELEKSGTWQLVTFILGIMTAGVGVVAVGAIAYAGFLYATAQDSAEQTKKAKDMIINTVIGIVAYGLMYVALNFLIPGGVFT